MRSRSALYRNNSNKNENVMTNNTSFVIHSRKSSLIPSKKFIVIAKLVIEKIPFLESKAILEITLEEVNILMLFFNLLIRLRKCAMIQ